MTSALLPMTAGGLFGSSTDRGFSPDAKTIRRELQSILLGFYDTYYITSVHRDARRALEETFKDASVENWDGYGAKRVSEKTYENALSFLQSLPSAVRNPEVAAEPDGEIAFEWRSEPNRVFSISVGEGDTLSFAGVAGRRKIHGTEVIYDEIPRGLLQQMGQTLA